MNDLLNTAISASNYIQSILPKDAKLALMLGTGFGSIDKILKNRIDIPYSEIPGIPTSTVKSHENYLSYGYINDVAVLVWNGRFHYYEGYDLDIVGFPVRVMKLLGVKTIIASNAAGGLHPDFKVGDIITVSDHINFLPANPLRGKHTEALGLRFPEMSSVYSSTLRSISKEVFVDLNYSYKEGVYLALQGPSLETPAEYKMLKILGADLVGMSTVPEMIVAKQCNIDCLVFSIVSNIPSDAETTIESVIEAVHQSAEKVLNILSVLITKINKLA